MSNVAAVMFFFTLQIPLSRLSPGFVFLTCFVVWFLDNQTKKWAYDIAGCFVRLDLEGLKDILFVEFDFADQDLPPVMKRRKEDTRAVVDWFCLHFVIMTSFVLNYLYRVALASLVETVAHWIITVSDAIGFELHFIRFLYWTLIDQDADPMQPQSEMAVDLCLLLLMFFMYGLAMHFLLSPLEVYYTGNV